MMNKITPQEDDKKTSRKSNRRSEEIVNIDWPGLALRAFSLLAVWVLVRYGLVFLAGGGPDTGTQLFDLFCAGLYWMWPLVAYLVAGLVFHPSNMHTGEKWFIIGLATFFIWPILLNLISLLLGWLGMQSVSDSLFAARWISQLWLLATVIGLMLGKLLILLISGKRRLWWPR